MQKTNFPYEILVGEDCSPDNTNEILAKYEERYPELEFDTDTSFFSTMHIHLAEGLQPADALKKYGTSFYINERYARLKNVSSEDFGQKTLQDILPRVRVKYILAGIIENYPTASLQKEINPQRIMVRESGDTYLGQIGKYVLIRLKPEKRKATLERIERIWKEMFLWTVFCAEMWASVKPR